MGSVHDAANHRNLVDFVENKLDNNTISKYVYLNDPIGRRTEVTKTGTAFAQPDSVTYGYNDRSEVVAADAANDPSYDYAYNYDPIGNRKTSSVTGAAPAPELTTYTTNPLNQYDTISGLTDPQYDLDGNMTFLPSTSGGGAGGEGSAYYTCYDANGNISEYIAQDGTLAAHYEYSPFGQTTTQTGTTPETFDHRFSTKYQDAETNVYYYGLRYYNGTVGRWLSRDMLGTLGGLNIYAFLANRTIAATDLLGLLRRNTANNIANSFLNKVPDHLWDPALLEPGSTECAEALLHDLWEDAKLIDFGFQLGVGLMFTAIGPLAEGILANLGLNALEQLIYVIHDGGGMSEADIANHITSTFSQLTPSEAQILIDIANEISQTQMGNFIGSGRLVSMESSDMFGGCGSVTRCEFYVTAETRMVGWFWPFRRETFDSWTIWGTCDYTCCECGKVQCPCGSEGKFTVNGEGTNAPFTIDGGVDIDYQSFSP